MENSEELKSVLAKLAGTRVCNLSGPVAGSRFYLDFDSDQSLGVGCACWRLDSSYRVITGSSDDSAVNGPMESGLQTLVDRKVVSAAAEHPAWDLRIEFEGGLTLRVFCEDIDEDGENYIIRHRDVHLTVGEKGRISREGVGRSAMHETD